MDQLTHRTHSPAASVSKAAREPHQSVTALYRRLPTSRALSIPLWLHSFCALAHLDQMMSCKDSYWLLSQTFPEMIGGVTKHSARDLYSELPPAPEEKVLVLCYINPV